MACCSPFAAEAVLPTISVTLGAIGSISMAVLSWSSDLDPALADEQIRLCFTRIDLTIDEEISNGHQLYARDQGPGRLIRAQLVSVLAVRATSSSRVYRFEVRSPESPLIRNSRAQQVATALKAELEALLVAAPSQAG